MSNLNCSMECSICLDDIKNYKEHTGMIKGCFHLFHFECLWDWLAVTEKCPLCREVTIPNSAYLRSLPFGYIMTAENLKQSVRCGTQRELIRREVTRILNSARGQRQTPSASALSSTSVTVCSETGNAGGTSQMVLPGQPVN